MDDAKITDAAKAAGWKASADLAFNNKGGFMNTGWTWFQGRAAIAVIRRNKETTPPRDEVFNFSTNKFEALAADGMVTITPAQLGYLLEGIDWRHPQHTWRPQAAG